MRLRSAPVQRLKYLSIAAVAAVAVLAAGCAKTNTSLTSHADAPQVSELTSQEDLSKALYYWSEAYSANPKNKLTSMNFAAALRLAGQTGQAVAILQRAAIYNSNDREVQAALGKALASDGNLELALATIARAQRPDQPDWKLVSAEGTILDQLERHEEARQKYAIALNLQPNEPTVLSNMGMSLLLSGELSQAETYFERALEQGARDIRIRQNYALAVGLQGRFAEAEQIAQTGMSPEAAAQNIAYLKQVLGDRAGRWDEVRRQG